MATPIEQAVIELQMVIREMNRRLRSLERRLGAEAESFSNVPDTPPAPSPAPTSLRDKKPPVRQEPLGEGATATLVAPEPVEGGAVDAAVAPPGPDVQVKWKVAPKPAETRAVDPLFDPPADPEFFVHPPPDLFPEEDAASTPATAQQMGGGAENGFSAGISTAKTEGEWQH